MKVNNNIIDKIISLKLNTLNDLKQKKSLSDLIDEVKNIQQNQFQNNISFTQKIKAKSRGKNSITNNPFFILECKQASPSQGMINNNFDLQNIINTYANFADAISVLCEENYFKGSVQNLQQVKQILNQKNIFDIPLLCKDFIIDEYQIYMAKLYGANAILLMLNVLDNNEYIYLSNVAKSLNLDVLTEISDEQEATFAIQCKAENIGINNRDFSTLKTDLKRTNLLVYFIIKNIKNNVSNGENYHPNLISESGFSNHSEIVEYSNIVDGFLIGTSLMKQHNNLDIACQKLLLGEIKICGITNAEDAKFLDNFNAYNKNIFMLYAGLIFVETSKRFVSIETAKNIVRQTKNLQYVAVFQNEQNIYKIISLLQNLDIKNIKIIQLHGDENFENIEYIQNLKSKLLNTFGENIANEIQIWKAVSASKVNSKNNLENLVKNYLLNGISKIILDNQNGGSGKTFDWNLIPEKYKQNIMLSGGINLNNLQEALNIGCAGIDISSGVELQNNNNNINNIVKKDTQKIQQLFKNFFNLHNYKK